MSEPLIEVRNLKKHFPLVKGPFAKKNGRVVKAVDGVSFSINSGESFGLVGESGSGKSTTGRCILNLLKPTSGQVYYDGKPLFDSEKGIALNKSQMLPFRREMQLIFQDPNASLDPRMTVGAIVEEGIRKHKIAQGAEASKLAGDFLELCGLERSTAKRYPSEFSGGQKQRIGIARALALSPRFIVADEPLSALDVSIQSQVLNLMSELKEKLHLTFLFISHDLKTVEYFCDKVGVLYLGTLVETGTTPETMTRPLHPYTQALFSAIPPDDPTADNPPRIPMIGEIPSATNMPSGCKFHTRCPYAVERCAQEEPQLTCAEGSHCVACHRWKEIAEGCAPTVCTSKE